MTPDIFTTHPDLVLFFAALFANCLLAGVLYGCSETSSRHLAQLQAWRRRTFADGQNCGCVDCNRWKLTAACLSCGRVRVMTATKTIATDGQTAASIAQARAQNTADRARWGIGADGRQILSFEERRRRAARVAFDEIDLDLDDVAVN